MTDLLQQKNKRLGFRHWFASDQGRVLHDYEQDYVATVLPTLFGYHIVQLGAPAVDNYLRSSRIAHQFVCQLEDEEDGLPGVQLKGSEEYLPFATDSIDVAVIPHVLEFAARPHTLLREVDRTLIGNGHILILGFNPWSLWGLWRLFLAWRDRVPWNGHFYSMTRLKDWLYLLDFEMVHSEKFIFRPPLRGNRLRDKLGFLEKLGKYCWPWFGGAYMILARKRVISLTPVRLRWQKKRQFATGVAEPTVRCAVRKQ